MDLNEKLNNILIAVDFSEESDKAVEFAAALVTHSLDTTLHIVHVIKPYYAPIGDATGTAEVLQEEKEEAIKKAKNNIEKIVTSLKAHGIKNVQGNVKIGDPVNMTIAAIDEYKVGLIIMGTRKHGFKKGIFMGSVSQRISANSKVSVLIVR
ncbi:MAG: universal stress protein [Thermoplasmataceae archaeon]